MVTAPKKRRGRPSVGDKAMLNPKTIRFPPALEQEIEAQIAARLDQPEFGAMVRELVAEALAARAKRRK